MGDPDDAFLDRASLPTRPISQRGIPRPQERRFESLDSSTRLQLHGREILRNLRHKVWLSSVEENAGDYCLALDRINSGWQFHKISGRRGTARPQCFHAQGYLQKSDNRRNSAAH